MLVLELKVEESVDFYIGDNKVGSVRVNKVRTGDRVSLGIEFDRDFKILREKLGPPNKS